jgi:hypothetical protein
MERERFNFTNGPDFNRDDDSSDEEFEATRQRTREILDHGLRVRQGIATAQNENTLQQLLQRGAQ